MAAKTRHLFKQFQEDLPCVHTPTLFNDRNKADTSEINAKKKDSGHQTTFKADACAMGPAFAKHVYARRAPSLGPPTLAYFAGIPSRRTKSILPTSAPLH